MLNEMMLVSGWVFWVIIAILIVIDATLLTADEDGPLSFAVALTLGVLISSFLFTDAFSRFSLVQWIAIACAYVACGVLWSIKKWYTFVVETLAQAKESFKKYGKQGETWAAYSKNMRPIASKNKQRIVAWMTLWPLSFTWWVLTWPRRVFNWIYDYISTVFDRITDRIWA